MFIALLTFFIILLQVAYLFDSHFLKIIPIIGLLISVLKYLRTNKTLQHIFKANSLLFAFSLIVVIGVVKNNNPTDTAVYLFYKVVTFILFLIVCSLLFFKLLNTDKTNSVKAIGLVIILPFCLLAIANFMLYALDIMLMKSAIGSEEGNFDAILLSYLGVSINRIEFPLAGGLNNYSSYIGALFGICLNLYFFSKSYRLLSVFSGVVFFITLLCIDSRAAIIYPILITILIFFLNKKKPLKKGFSFLSLLVVLGPVFIAFLLPLISTIPGLEIISRGDEDLKTGNSRLIIWVIAFAEFVSFKSVHIFGYGEYGHFASGASKKWGVIFSSWENSDMKTPHSTLFSIIFDYGYVGLILYVTLIYSTLEKIRTLWTIKPIIAYVSFSYILYNILSGITETLNGFYFPNYMLLFAMVVILVNIQYYIIKKKETKSNGF